MNSLVSTYYHMRHRFSISNIRYLLRSRLIPRYRRHIVKTGLKPGWYDSDKRMLHACFELLVEFVEWESDGVEELQRFTGELAADPGQGWEGEREALKAQSDRQQEILDLYDWWTNQRPATLRKHDSEETVLFGPDGVWAVDEARVERFREFEESMEAEELEMTIRLMKIRTSLWV